MPVEADVVALCVTIHASRLLPSRSPWPRSCSALHATMLTLMPGPLPCPALPPRPVPSSAEDQHNMDLFIEGQVALSVAAVFSIIAIVSGSR